MVFNQHETLARTLSIQRASTVGNRTIMFQVEIRNTHNSQDFHGFRQVPSAIGRSQSHMTKQRITVLAPKRSERARLEAGLGDIWTKDSLPYPAMNVSRGGQIIRASAGSLVRKLSLASIHAPFSRRSASLTLSSKKSYDAVSDGRKERETVATPRFEIRKDSYDDMTPSKLKCGKSHDLPELDTMDNVVNRMIAGAGMSKAVVGNPVTIIEKKEPDSGSSHNQRVSKIEEQEKPDQDEKAEQRKKGSIVEQGLGGKKKRWSNPVGLLKGLSSEGFRHMLYSSRS